MPKQKSFMTCCKKSALSEQRKNGWGSFGCPISRRSRCGGVRIGTARLGKAVQVWRGAVWHGMAGSGEAVEEGAAGCGTARHGLVGLGGFGELRHGGQGWFRLGLVRRGELRRGGLGVARSGKSWLGRAVTGYKGESDEVYEKNASRAY